MGENTFPKEKRLIAKACYQRVFQDGRKLPVSELLFVIGKNTYNYPRLGLAISKKNVPTAVDRNRIKRIIRENFRQLKNSAGIELGHIDIIVVARRNLAKLSNEHLRARLDYAWKKISSFGEAK